MKTIAFVDNNNKVVNVALFEDDATVELIELICADNGGVAYYDTAIYGVTEVGGEFFDNYLYTKSPFPSWLKSEGKWIAPVPYPQDGKEYYWEESETNWIIIN